MNKNRRHAIYPALIILVTIALYWNSLSGDFIWDDRGLIVDNATYLGDWNNLYEGFCKPFFGDTPYYRPLLTGSFIVDYQLWGTEPFGYHLTNILLHSVNALLVYVFVFVLVQQAGIALWTSLLFTAHPVQSEAVAWISGRNDLMLTLFALTSIILHLRWTHFQGWRRYLAYACCLLAYMGTLLTKESGIMLPLLFMLIDYFFPDSRRNKIKDYAGILLISALYYFAKLSVVGDMGIALRAGEISYAIPKIVTIYAYYLKMLFFPLFQSAVPEIAGSGAVKQYIIISSFSLLTGLVALAIICLKKCKEISFIILWVLVALIPVCGIVPLSVPALEHRLYMGTVCYSMLLPIIVYRLSSLKTQTRQFYKAKAIVPLLMTAVLILYTAKTLSRNDIWQNEFFFWVKTVQDSPGSSVARNNLGIVYARAGNHQMAIREFKIALALRNQENIYGAGLRRAQQGKLFNNLGQCYYQLLQKLLLDEEYVSTAGAGDKTNAEQVRNESQRLYRLSLAYYQRAVRINPANADVHNNLGDLFYVMKNYTSAEEEYKKALEINPDNATYYNNLGLVYYGLQSFSRAVAMLTEAISLQPDFLEARNNLALVYMHQGMYTRALDELNIALSSGRNNSDVCFNLSLVYLRGFNDSERAIHYLKEGLRLSSRDSNNAMLKNGF